MSQNQIVFTPYEIKDCFFDRERTLNLKRAIDKIVKEGDIVLEAGGGTGVLSMFALMAGAKHAYIVELSGRFTNVIREIAERNGLSDRITVINGDATETDIPEDVDVYISELLCTGLFNEPQVQAYNNLRRFFKKDVTCIPSEVTSHLAFAEAEQMVYGLDIACDSYLAEDIPFKQLTESDMYMHIKFDGSWVNPLIKHRGSTQCNATGTVNSAVFLSTALLAEGIIAGKTKFLFNPELVFFKNTRTFGCEFGSNDFIGPDLTVTEDRICVDYDIEYIAGCDTLDIKLGVF